MRGGQHRGNDSAGHYEKYEVYFSNCRGGGIGRRKRLKSVREQSHESSILSRGTKIEI